MILLLSYLLSPEMRDHLFYLCKYAKEFWEQFEEFWMSITKQNVILSLKDIIVGVIETNASLLNYLIVLRKYFIWNSRTQNNFPKFYLFTSLIKTKFKTEHYIAAKNNAYSNV